MAAAAGATVANEKVGRSQGPPLRSESVENETNLPNAGVGRGLYEFKEVVGVTELSRWRRGRAEAMLQSKTSETSGWTMVEVNMVI